MSIIEGLREHNHLMSNFKVFFDLSHVIWNSIKKYCPVFFFFWTICISFLGSNACKEKLSFFAYTIYKKQNTNEQKNNNNNNNGQCFWLNCRSHAKIRQIPEKSKNGQKFNMWWSCSQPLHYLFFIYCVLRENAQSPPTEGCLD